MTQTRRYIKPLVQRQYIVNCKGCGKRLRDPLDNPIYVVRSVEKPINQLQDNGEYWCRQACMDKHDPTRKEAKKQWKLINAQDAAYPS